MRPDSMVLVPYQDLLSGATYRIVDREGKRRATMAVASLSSEAQELRKALDAERHAREQAERAGSMLDRRYNECADALLVRQRRSGRPNAQGIALGVLAGAVGALILTR